MTLLNLIWVFIISFSISTVSTAVVMWWYKKNNWLDDPQKSNHNKVIHTKSVPRGGGIPIFITVFLSSLLFLGFDKHITGIILGAFLLALVGVYDDLLDINPYFRLFTGFLASICVVAAGIGIAYVTNPFGYPGSVIMLNNPQIALEILGKTRTIWVIADILAVLWILWTMNMVNWSKGVDGQMPGFVAIASIVIAILSMRFSADITQGQVTFLAIITAAAYLGLLVWNAYPQKIMPGYGAGSLAGYLLAVLSILSGAKLAALILILGIPTLDAIYVIYLRLKKGKSPVWGDREHLHHRLLDLGWSKKSVAYFYWLSTGILGAITLFLNSTQKFFSFLVLCFLVIGVLRWLQFMVKDYAKD